MATHIHVHLGRTRDAVSSGNSFGKAELKKALISGGLSEAGADLVCSKVSANNVVNGTVEGFKVYAGKTGQGGSYSWSLS
jgi:hypothetical protein